MDLNKSLLYYQRNVPNLRKWFHNHPEYIESKTMSPLNNSNKFKENFMWHCLDYDLLLQPDFGAQKTKKHQNIFKNKSDGKDFFDLKNNRFEPFSTIKTDLFDRRFKQPCSAKYNFIHNNLELSNKFNKIIPPPVEKDNILETVIKAEKRNLSSGDLSIYRTPSGKYYCKMCDLTVNSPAQFLQHLESRKHRHKAGRAWKGQ